MKRRWLNIILIMALIMPLMPMGGFVDYSYAEGFEDIDFSQFLSKVDETRSEGRHCVHCSLSKPKAAGALRRIPIQAPTISSTSPLPYASAIQRSVRWGYTRDLFGLCARAVWRILIKAGLVRGSWYASGADAINMGSVLKRQGFIRDDTACNRPGVVRIYNGNRSGHRFRNSMAGDRVGHIEILGLDRQFHHFLPSPYSISENMRQRYGYASRRPLQSCWIKPTGVRK